MRFNGKKVSDMSYDEQLEMLKTNGSLIKCIKNPTEEHKYVAVETSPFSIRFIHNPSEELQMLAIKISPYSIRAITEPSEMVQIEAAKQYSPDEVELLKSDILNPCEEVIEIIRKLKHSKR